MITAPKKDFAKKLDNQDKRKEAGMNYAKLVKIQKAAQRRLARN